MRWPLIACLALAACSGKKHGGSASAAHDAAPPAFDAGRATTPCDTDDGLAKQLGLPPDKLSCVHRAPDFPGVILVGSFASDRGCAPELLLIDCQKHDGPIPTALLLNRAGWGSADGPQRQALALRYLRQVATVFRGTVADTPDPPSATTTPDGQVIIEAWVNQPAGMRPGRRASKLRYTFGSDGRVSSEPIDHIDEQR